MPTPKIHNIPNGVYFLTCSIVNKMDVFTYKEFFDIIISSLSFCREGKGLLLHGYVIMPNHVHLIASNENDLAGVIRDFKRFTAVKIIEQLIKFKRNYILNLLKFVVKQKSKQQHQVWIHANYAEGIVSSEFFRQKLNYIHDNPVKRGLVMLQEEWIYSSAKNYLMGDDSVIKIDKFI